MSTGNNSSALRLRLFDVHTHLQDKRLDGDHDTVIERARQAGVAKVVSCGVHEGDWEKLSFLSRKYNNIIPAYGLHPWFISYRTSNFLFDLEQLIKYSTAGVGEIGLDRMVKGLDIEDQKEVFILQFRLALKYKRPVNIHCRKAWGLLADILKEEGGLPYGGVIHSYSGSKDMVKIFEALGASISFSGSVTKPDNKKVRKAVVAVSDDRLLLETDTPDILPSGATTDLNEPSNLTLILSEVASLRNSNIATISKLTYVNAERLFETDKDLL